MSILYKKAAALMLLGAVFAVVLAACGGEDPTATPAPTNTPTAAPAPTATLAPGVPTPTPAPATPTPAAPTATPVPEFDAEAYFKGKNIRLMVGYNPGGGTDAQARYMSKAWRSYIPGNPRIIVSNMTPDITQRNFVWNAKADGLILSLEATGGIFDSVLDVAEYDMREVSMVGVTSGKSSVWLIRGTMPYVCGDTAFNKPDGEPLIFGTSAPTPADLGATVAPAWLGLEFGMPVQIKNVAAAGSAEQYLMMERGDTNSWYTGSVWAQLPVQRPGWTESEFVRGFIDMSFPGYTLGANAEMDFPCPNAETYLTTDEQKSIWSSITGTRTYASKNIIGPPNMHPGALKALRDALEVAMTTPEFVQGLEDFTGIQTSFTAGAQAQQELIDTTNSFLDNRDKITAIQAEVHKKFVN
jgi:hypothetical protein